MWRNRPGLIGEARQKWAELVGWWDSGREKILLVGSRYVWARPKGFLVVEASGIV